MAEIKAFKGVRYDSSKVKPEEVITLPYDKIGPKLQEEYYGRSPYNMVRLLLGKEISTDNGQTNKYTRAREYLTKWEKEGVLVPEKEDAIYFCEQHYIVPGTGEKKVRHAFIGLGKLEEFESEIVRPHEHTLAKPKADRMNLLRTAKANFGLIFMLYDDPTKLIDQMAGYLTTEEVTFDFVDDQGVRNRLWVIHDQQLIAQIQKMMNDKVLFIADGHHRYETALSIKKEKENEPHAAEYEYTLMAFVNMAEEGLTVLPTHRLVKNIPNWDSNKVLKECENYFEVQSVKGIDSLFKTLNQDQEGHSIGLYLKGAKIFLLKLKGEEQIQALEKEGMSPEVAKLDVMLLQKYLLENSIGLSSDQIKQGENLFFCRDAKGAMEAVEKGEFQALFLLNPTKVQEVKEVCLSGQVMPQKSTDFYPKLLSGLVIQKIE